MSENTTLFEVRPYLDGVHYTKAGWPADRVAMHRSMLRQATCDVDGRYFILVPNRLLEEMRDSYEMGDE